MAKKMAVISCDTNDIVAVVVEQTDKTLALDWDNGGEVARSDFVLVRPDEFSVDAVYKDTAGYEFLIQVLG